MAASREVVIRRPSFTEMPLKVSIVTFLTSGRDAANRNQSYRSAIQTSGRGGSHRNYSCLPAIQSDGS